MTPRALLLIAAAVALPLACTIWNGVELPAKVDGGSTTPTKDSDAHTDGGEARAQAYANAIRDTKPIAYWRFDTIDASRVIRDSSGNNRNCTASSGVTIEDGPVPGMSAARLHQGDDIDCSGDTAFDMVGTTPFTFEGFVLHQDDGPRSSGEFRFLFDRMGGGNESSRIGYYALLGRDANDDDWGLGFEHWRGNSKLTGVVASGPSELAAGKWAHFAFTIEASGLMTAYLNGSQGQQNTTQTGPSPSGVHLILGTNQDRGCCALDGKLADVALYARALDATTIEQHYRAAYPAGP